MPLHRKAAKTNRGYASPPDVRRIVAPLPQPRPLTRERRRKPSSPPTLHLARKERLQIVDQGLRILNDSYVHLRMKQAMHAIDPVGRLELLRRAVLGKDDDDHLDDNEFHREMLDIFFSLRDRHTVYTLPDIFEGRIASLPFMVEEIREGGKRKYIVSKILDAAKTRKFREGVEIVQWNGVPIRQAVWNYAQRHAGSNTDARRAMGLINLTLRALQYDPPPDERWVEVEYRNGKLLSLRFDWDVGDNPWPREKPPRSHDGALASDPRLSTVQSARAALYAPKRTSRGRREAKAPVRGVSFEEVPTKTWRVFRARRYATPEGTFGYIRIWKFNDMSESGFVDEFVSIVQKLPQDGLIIDIRGNPGGKINLAEATLQTLTPVRIHPEPFQFRNTALAEKLCVRAPDSEGLKIWRQSIQEGLRTGATYSAAFPKSDQTRCNSRPQAYFGAVVLITDALTYSAGDIFAAGFQDHRIGWVLGIHETTGAGGANKWSYDKLLGMDLPGHPYELLPHGAGFNVAMRRSLRVLGNNGAILEDFGVRADRRHEMTRHDVLNDNVDLIRAAAEVLRGRPPRRSHLELRTIAPTGRPEARPA